MNRARATEPACLAEAVEWEESMDPNSGTRYSSAVQGALLLDFSRERRFRDDRSALLLDLLGLRPAMTVADLGCGPGALTRKLAAWLGPSSRIIGVDQDGAFLEYARRKARAQGLQNVTFIGGDVLRIPLAGQSVDGCTSYTVMEHVPNRAFLLEQKRICRPGGAISVMVAQPKSYIRAGFENAPPMTDRERELRETLDAAQGRLLAEAGPGAFWPEPGALPRLFTECGLTAIQVDALAVPVAADDARNSVAVRMSLVDEQEAVDLEYVARVRSAAPEAMPEERAQELRKLIIARHNQRRRLLQEGIAVWDYEIALMLILRGTA